MSGELLTTRETAQLLRLSIGTVYAKLQSGELPSFRLGASPRSELRVARADLEEYLEAHKSASSREVAA